jgi:hypothetical protein
VTVRMPAMVPAQEAGWIALIEIASLMPTGWTLVGGQMVHLHCIERGQTPMRATIDLDAILDVRLRPHVLHDFTEVLAQLGFRSAGVSPWGHQHRWMRGVAQIDVLIPRHLGERASARQGVGGGTTVAAPGAQQALDRTERIEVEVAGRVGVVPRPNLVGALVAKAATIAIPVDPGRGRHVSDFALLASLLRVADLQGQDLAPRDIRHLRAMIPRVTEEGVDVQGAERGIAMLNAAIRRAERR